ncbi:hypothetical protein HZB08_00940 [Candidatus Saganbacteria bacterium]|uniref:histidine kinase n=1 Tax=Candidatus Saganbacteria bacterium TaxID=2575572 RepID=A0A9D6YV11_UNCSA|nr:hypothetical protein [Candidatus Saganbacteria bacterium]
MENILSILDRTFREVMEVSNPRVYLAEDFDRPEVKERLTLKEISLKGGELVIPCRLEERTIVLIVLGKKLSEDPYTDEDIRLLSALAGQTAVAIDHTRTYEEIKRELETTHVQLDRSQRLASLGTLTAGVTHEIRNPLAVIRAETERLANEPRDLDYLKQHRDLLLRQVDRISGIVRRMLSLAKAKPKQRVEVKLSEVIDATLQLFNICRVAVKKEYQAIPPIAGDPEELQEVFINLIQNALEAMPTGGTLTLRTFLENGRVAAEVSDTGRGIPAEMREKIFDPFFSTRHEGTGLGLPISYRIVREHGGDIKVTSQEGKGTTFRVLF